MQSTKSALPCAILAAWAALGEVLGGGLQPWRGGAADQSDSGRSLLPNSLQREDTVLDQRDHLAEDAVRGLTAGLGPWQAQAHVTAHEEYNRLYMPFLLCRSRFVSSLKSAGPQAELLATTAFLAGRDALDQTLDSVLSNIPEDWDQEPEIALIKVSLDAGERYPAGDILELRSRRLTRLSQSAPDDFVQNIRTMFRESVPVLWLAVEWVLLAEDSEARVRVPVSAKDTLSKFRKCLQHRLMPSHDFRSDMDGLKNTKRKKK